MVVRSDRGRKARRRGPAIVIWFGWQLTFDTRHVNFDWMNSTD
jgi:hypothetical protein